VGDDTFGFVRLI